MYVSVVWSPVLRAHTHLLGVTLWLVQLSKVRPRPAAPRPFGSRVAARDFDVDALDYTKKVLHYSWHPRENIIAVAGLNNLYIYNAY